jgi:hypothetical protein
MRGKGSVVEDVPAVSPRISDHRRLGPWTAADGADGPFVVRLLWSSELVSDDSLS